MAKDYLDLPESERVSQRGQYIGEQGRKINPFENPIDEAVRQSKAYTDSRLITGLNTLILTGISFLSALAVTAQDTALEAFGKIQAQLSKKADKTELTGQAATATMTFNTSNTGSIKSIPISFTANGASMTLEFVSAGAGQETVLIGASVEAAVANLAAYINANAFDVYKPIFDLIEAAAEGKVLTIFYRNKDVIGNSFIVASANDVIISVSTAANGGNLEGAIEGLEQKLDGSIVIYKQIDETRNDVVQLLPDSEFGWLTDVKDDALYYLEGFLIVDVAGGFRFRIDASNQFYGWVMGNEIVGGVQHIPNGDNWEGAQDINGATLLLKITGWIRNSNFTFKWDVPAGGNSTLRQGSYLKFKKFIEE